MAKGMCSIEGCSRDHYARSWCKMHYRRWVRHGDPTKLVQFDLRGDLKRCPDCETWLSLDAFWRSSRGPSGRQACCKSCQVVRKDRWKAENIEQVREYHRLWRLKNIEKERERLRRQRIEKPEIGLEASRRYRARHPEKGVANARAWQARNPGKVKGYASARRARKRSTATDTIDHHKIFERDEWTCHLCEKPIDPLLLWPDKASASLDHVLPLALGGAHTMDNVAAAHLLCNMRKGARLLT